MTTDASTSPHFVRAVAALATRCPVVVRSPIVNTLGVKVLDQGVVIDERLYARLMSHRLARPLAECVGSERMVTADEVREAALALIEQEPIYALMAGQGKRRDTLLTEIALIPLPAPVAFQLTVMRETRPAAWSHALRAAVAAAWLVGALQGSRFDIRHLALAGLVHDLGLLHLDPVLDSPKEALSAGQRRQLYSHALLSVAQLERHHQFPGELLSAVLEHHEALDGSGYPRQLAGAAISPWGRILALVELVVGRFNGERPLPAARLTVALRLNRHRYDTAGMNEVMQLLRGLPKEPTPAPERDPKQRLGELEALLQRWPADAPAQTPPARGRAVAAVRAQAEQVMRNLATAGATQAQLLQLGPDMLDDELHAELDLLAGELAWQVRAVARQARRRWRRVADEVLPDWMVQWLEAVDLACAAVPA
jgi:hypothetical protein